MFWIARGLHVGSNLGHEDELEIRMNDPHDPVSAWLTRRQILALITHLGKVLDEADELETMK